MTGDTAAAIRAHTLSRLAGEPDWGPWRAERDAVERELAGLVGESRRLSGRR
jgi:hypothetical protein